MEHYVLVLTLLPVFQNEPANSRIPRLVLQILISQGIVGSTPNLFNQPNPPRSGNLGSCWCNWSICLAKKEKQFNPATSAKPRAVSHFLCGAEEETVTSVGELKWVHKKVLHRQIASGTHWHSMACFTGFCSRGEKKGVQVASIPILEFPLSPTHTPTSLAQMHTTSGAPLTTSIWQHS